MAEECTHECGSCGVVRLRRAHGARARRRCRPNAHSNIKHVIAVVSGKGGVGKSLVTSLLASQMQKRGFKVGILDADVTGPSIPKTFGITGPAGRPTSTASCPPPTAKRHQGHVREPACCPPRTTSRSHGAARWCPAPSASSGARRNWGDIDYLFVDMPPGTSDVFLTVFQSAAGGRHRHRVGPAGAGRHDRGQGRATWRTDLNVPVVGLVGEHGVLRVRRVRQEALHLRRAAGRGRGREVRHPRATPRCRSTRPFARLCDAGKVEEYDVEGALDTIVEQVEAAHREEKAE